MSTNIDGQGAWDELSSHGNAQRGNAAASPPPANQPIPDDVMLGTINSTLFEMATNGRDQQAAVWKEIQLLKAMIVELQTTVGNTSPSDGWERTPSGDPICPRHGVAMRKREKQGDVWYSHSVDVVGGDSTYCKGMPGKDSPGWDHGTARAGYVDGAAVVIPSKMPTPPVDGSKPVMGVRPVAKRPSVTTARGLPTGSGAQTIGELCNALDAEYQMFGGGAGSLSFFDTVFGEGTFHAMSARGYAVAFQAYVDYVTNNYSPGSNLAENHFKSRVVHDKAKARMLEAYRGEMGNA